MRGEIACAAVLKRESRETISGKTAQPRKTVGNPPVFLMGV